MKLIDKYIVLFFEIDDEGKKLIVRRIVQGEKVYWEFTLKEGWANCDENYKEILRPSVLEPMYKNYLRTSKFERIFNV